RSVPMRCQTKASACMLPGSDRKTAPLMKTTAAARHGARELVHGREEGERRRDPRGARAASAAPQGVMQRDGGAEPRELVGGGPRGAYHRRAGDGEGPRGAREGGPPASRLPLRRSGG